ACRHPVRFLPRSNPDAKVRHQEKEQARAQAGRSNSSRRARVAKYQAEQCVKDETAIDERIKVGITINAPEDDVGHTPDDQRQTYSQPGLQSRPAPETESAEHGEIG